VCGKSWRGRRAVNDEQEFEKGAKSGWRKTEMKLIDFNDVKVGFASVGGLGNWMLEIDTVLHILISVASLVYIILKIVQLIKNNKNEG
jgi:hypothetical protein